MEAVEFFVIGGQTCLRHGSMSKRLTPNDREEVVWMLERMRDCFPVAVSRLESWAEDSRANRHSSSITSLIVSFVVTSAMLTFFTRM